MIYNKKKTEGLYFLLIWSVICKEFVVEATLHVSRAESNDLVYNFGLPVVYV